VATDWAEQSAYIDEKDISQENTKNKVHFDKHYISKESTKLLGNMLQKTMPNNKLSLSTRRRILSSVVSCYIRLKRDKNLSDIASSLLNYATKGDLNSASPNYRRTLLEIFNTLDDYQLKSEAKEFRAAIESAIQ
ncbi:hypothetical protein J9A42_31195, partial [Klebsiella pneumoniae]